MFATPRSVSVAARDLDGINAVGRKLFVVRGEIRGGKAELAAELLRLRSTVPRMVYSRPSKRAAVAKSPASTARRMSVLLTIWPSIFTAGTPTSSKPSSCAELLEQREIARAAFAEGPFVADADFAQRSAGRGELRG